MEYSSKDNANYEIQDAIEVKVLTQEDKLLLQGSFENSSDPKELENNTIDFVIPATSCRNTITRIN